MVEVKTETFTFNKEEIIELMYCVRKSLPFLRKQPPLVRDTISGVVARLDAAYKRLDMSQP